MVITPSICGRGFLLWFLIRGECSDQLLQFVPPGLRAFWQENAKALRQGGLLKAALSEQKASVTDEAKIFPVNFVERCGQRIDLYVGVLGEDCKHRSIVIQTIMQKKRFGSPCFTVDVNSRLL